MNILFICPFAHTNIIRKSNDLIGRIPPALQCTHLRCGHSAKVFLDTIMDESLTPTHEFYKPSISDVLSVEEVEYCSKGGLLFREIPENVGKEVMNEFISTQEMVKIAKYLVDHFPEQTGIGTPVEAAIRVIDTLREEIKNMVPLTVGKRSKKEPWREN